VCVQTDLCAIREILRLEDGGSACQTRVPAGERRRARPGFSQPKKKMPALKIGEVGPGRTRQIKAREAIKRWSLREHVGRRLKKRDSSLQSGLMDQSNKHEDWRKKWLNGSNDRTKEITGMGKVPLLTGPFITRIWVRKTHQGMREERMKDLMED